MIGKTRGVRRGQKGSEGVRKMLAIGTSKWMV